MRTLLLLAVAMLAGCDGCALGGAISRWHDDEAKVTCWVTSSRGAISCLPDKALSP